MNAEEDSDGRSAPQARPPFCVCVCFEEKHGEHNNGVVLAFLTQASAARLTIAFGRAVTVYDKPLSW